MTVEEELERMLGRSAGYVHRERTEAESYALGVALLERHGVRLTLSGKGPYAYHFVEGAEGERTEAVVARAKEAVWKADPNLRVFMAGLFNGKTSTALARYAKEALAEQKRARANEGYRTAMEALRKENEELKRMLGEGFTKRKEGYVE